MAVRTWTWDDDDMPDEADEVQPCVADHLNPTDEELAAAVERGLANGTLVDAGEWMARNAPS